MGVLAGCSLALVPKANCLYNKLRGELLSNLARRYHVVKLNIASYYPLSTTCSERVVLDLNKVQKSALNSSLDQYKM